MRILACLALVLIACGDDGTDADMDAGTSDVGTDAPADASGADWVLEFEDMLDDVDGPFVPDYATLPLSLFPDDGSRWTQIQNTHEGDNTMGMVMRDGATALQCFASAQPEGTASKMDVGRQAFAFTSGDRVRITTRLMLLGASPFDENTLIDLEDSDDLLLDGENPGAGLRIRTDAAGRVALDRGELPGRETADGEAVARLSTLRSDTVLPVGSWFELETVLQLGLEPRSESGPLDDIEGANAWVEIRLDGEPVLRARGSNFFDQSALDEVVEGMDVTVSWVDDTIDFDSFQIGATNNRSGMDREVLVDWVRIESFR